METSVLFYVKPEQLGICSVTQGVFNLVLSDNLEGWDGVGDGMEFQEGGDMCIPVTHSC